MYLLDLMGKDFIFLSQGTTVNGLRGSLEEILGEVPSTGKRGSRREFAGKESISLDIYAQKINSGNFIFRNK